MTGGVGGGDTTSEFFARMRAAADVMDAVNERYSDEHPRAGNSPNEPISASSMRFLADHWEAEES